MLSSVGSQVFDSATFEHRFLSFSFLEFLLHLSSFLLSLPELFMLCQAKCLRFVNHSTTIFIRQSMLCGANLVEQHLAERIFQTAMSKVAQWQLTLPCVIFASICFNICQDSDSAAAFLLSS